LLERAREQAIKQLAIADLLIAPLSSGHRPTGNGRVRLAAVFVAKLPGLCDRVHSFLAEVLIKYATNGSKPNA
jgi:hypothetical protein